MTNSNLKFFMLDSVKNQEVVEVPGVETYKDDAGEIIPFKIKMLDTEEINRIRYAYRTRKMALDGKKKPVISNGEIVYTTEYDGEKSNDKIMAEAFVFPDMHDKELMAFHGVYEACELPRKVFRRPADYAYASKMVAEVIGLIEKEDDDMVNEVKN